MTQFHFLSEEVEKLIHEKIKHGQLFLFVVRGMRLVFRPLTVQESEALLSLSDKISTVLLEDWVVKTTYVVGSIPLNVLMDETPYNLVESLANKIMINSNIQTEEAYLAKLEESRAKADTLQEVVEATICRALGLDPATVKGMTQFKQISLLAKAESLLGDKLKLGKSNIKNKLRQFSAGASVIGGEDITSPAVADKPDFDETF